MVTSSSSTCIKKKKKTTSLLPCIIVIGDQSVNWLKEAHDSLYKKSNNKYKSLFIPFDHMTSTNVLDEKEKILDNAFEWVQENTKNKNNHGNIKCNIQCIVSVGFSDYNENVETTKKNAILILQSLLQKLDEPHGTIILPHYVSHGEKKQPCSHCKTRWNLQSNDNGYIEPLSSQQCINIWNYITTHK